MDTRVACTLAPQARAVLDALGRTEDVTFSPDGRRLAIAGFARNRIAVLEVGIAVEGGRPAVVIAGAVELEARTLHHPHGLCFLDDATVAVANRSGGVQVYALPPPGAGRVVAEPTATVTGGTAAPTRAPGSVAARALGADWVELLVCDNTAHVVTRHLLDRRSGHASTHDEVLLQRRLDIPDGICLSADGAWIAISNHNSHEVFLYRRTPALGRESVPDAVLRNVMCPHGLRFTADMRHLLVADAHARYVNVYERGPLGWEGVRDPVRMVPVLDWRTYLAGRTNPQEGGPKGIDLHPGMRVVACTTEHETLAFHDLAAMLGEGRARPENRHKRRIQWRVAHAIHRRNPAIYGWLKPFWR